MSPVIVWSIIFALLMALAYYVTRLAGGNRQPGKHDAGLAILHFGRAFPGEAIRALQATADGEAIFLRLHGGKAGLMRNRGNHYACHLVGAGGARLTPLADGKGFSAEFPDAPSQNGVFTFAGERESAEVSLWLLQLALPASGAGRQESRLNPDRAS